MLTNEQRAHDFAIMLIQFEYSIVGLKSLREGESPKNEKIFDFEKMYKDFYRRALEFMQVTFPD